MKATHIDYPEYSKAKENRTSRYISKIRCKQGHLGERLTSNTGCVVCNSLRPYSVNKKDYAKKSYNNAKLTGAYEAYKPRKNELRKLKRQALNHAG